MNYLEACAYSPCFSSEEWKAIQAHTAENFTEVSFIKRDKFGCKTERKGRFNCVTNEIMNLDSERLISVKTGIIAFVNPIFLGIRVCFHAVRGSKKVGKTLFSSLYSIIRNSYTGEESKVDHTQQLSEIPGEIAFRIREIGRGVFFHAKIEGAAILGLVDPLKARKMIQLSEFHLNHEREFHHSQIHRHETIFVYSCMQPIVYDVSKPSSTGNTYVLQPKIEEVQT